jgi:molybdopterin-guanine dinucleotide biosynthesis protein A
MSHSSYNQNLVVGAILAGGRSRRMGAGEKGLKPLAGKAMIAHVIERLLPQVGALVINANGGGAAYGAFGLPVAADVYGDYAGPLAGLLTVMRWAQTHHPSARWVATAACDTPFIPANYVEMLARAALPSPDTIALAASSGGTHYVLGLWPLDLADGLAGWLAKGERKVQLWVERHPHVTVAYPDEENGAQRVDPFFNANTPDDFATAERLIKETPK